MLVGERFGYREHPWNVGDPLSPAEVVKEEPHRSSKVKVRWLDGEYEGLEVWVPKARLVVSWEEAEATPAGERRILVACGGKDATHTTPWEAADTVFLALPRSVEVGFGNRFFERDLLSILDLAKAAPRIGMSPAELLAEPGALVDRRGEYRAPFETALKVARARCARFARRCFAVQTTRRARAARR